MTYQDTINWMFSQLPMYQRQGKSAYKADLNNTLLLAEHIKNPQNKIKTIHVAGTNGKGSTSHMLSSILQEAGYKVGLFTSPHLKDFRERIKINGTVVSKVFVNGFIKRNKAFLEEQSLSFFEMTSGMAFDYFSKQKVADFENKRLTHHQKTQDDFFRRYSVVNTAQRKLARGESVWLLAQQNGVPMWLLRQYNTEVNFNRVSAGTRLVLPIIQPKK